MYEYENEENKNETLENEMPNLIKPFRPNIPILYPLKRSENILAF